MPKYFSRCRPLSFLFNWDLITLQNFNYKRSWIWEEYLISVAGFEIFWRKIVLFQWFFELNNFVPTFPRLILRYTSPMKQHLMWWFQLFSLLFSSKIPGSCWNFAVWNDLLAHTSSEISSLAAMLTAQNMQVKPSPQLGSAHSLVEHLLVLTSMKAKGPSRPFWLMFWSYCYKCRWDSVLLSVDLWGELNSCRKSKYGSIYFKRVSSNFILPEIQCQALSALQLLSCSVLG